MSSANSIKEKIDRIRQEIGHPKYRGLSLYEQAGEFNKGELLAALSYPDPKMREIALLHLAKTFKPALNPDDAKIILPLLSDESARVRKATSTLLAALAPHGRTMLVDALNHASPPSTVSAAVGILGEPTGFDEEARRQSLGLLLDTLGNDDSDAMYFLLNNRHREAVPWLMRTILNEQMPEKVTKQAATLLAHMPTEEDVPFFKAMLQSTRTTTRFAAALALCRIPEPSVVEILMARISEPDPRTRNLIFKGLAFSKNPVVIATLRAGLADSVDEVAITSIRGIGDFKDRESVRALVALMHGKEKLMLKQVLAGQVIAALTGTDFEFCEERGFCGTPAMEAGSMIRAGKLIDGEEGKSLVIKGEEQLAAYNRQTAEFLTQIEKKNIAERYRLFDWWEAKGSKIF